MTICFVSLVAERQPTKRIVLVLEMALSIALISPFIFFSRKYL